MLKKVFNYKVVTICGIYYTFVALFLSYRVLIGSVTDINKAIEITRMVILLAVFLNIISIIIYCVKIICKLRREGFSASVKFYSDNEK